MVVQGDDGALGTNQWPLDRRLAENRWRAAIGVVVGILSSMKGETGRVANDPARAAYFNTAMPGIDGYGAVIFAVPSAQAAMEGMTDTLRLDVELQGKSIVGVDYSGGFAARDQLKQCIARRR
jgi:hypothetical protein